jgi:hypothetical protein
MPPSFSGRHITIHGKSYPRFWGYDFFEIIAILAIIGSSRPPRRR